MIKLPEKDMISMMKGDKILFVIRLFEKSFWGNFSQLCEFPIKTIFIRENFMKEGISSGQYSLNFELKVNKPTKPIGT